MKIKLEKILFLFAMSMFLYSCGEDDSLEGAESYLDTSTPELTELDIYIRDTFVAPYNIEVLYKWKENEVDLNRYLYPPEVDKVRPALEVVKHIWIDTYDDVGGEDFVKKIDPRQLLLSGGINLNQSATITLGLAEGGKKITFFQTDFLDTTDEESIIEFMSTIQHEYTHILNQTKPFDEEAYGAITPSNYTGQWFNNSIEDSRELGYITAYARAAVVEDFAEMVKTMLINSNQEWNAIIDSIDSEQARQDIRRKEAMVEEYFQSAFGISIYDLQDEAYEHTQDVL